MSGEGSSFRYVIKAAGRRLFEIEYDGYMPADDSHVLETERLVVAQPEPVGLYYQVHGFSGFHRSQIMTHADMFGRLGPRVVGIAVVGARPVVRFGAITISLMAKTPLKTFDDRREAMAWLVSLLR